MEFILWIFAAVVIGIAIGPIVINWIKSLINHN